MTIRVPPLEIFPHSEASRRIPAILSEHLRGGIPCPSPHPLLTLTRKSKVAKVKRRRAPLCPKEATESSQQGVNSR